MMRHIAHNATEVFRVVRTTTYKNGSTDVTCFGPYPTLPSAKGARSVLARASPHEGHHLERALLTCWKRAE